MFGKSANADSLSSPVGIGAAFSESIGQAVQGRPSIALNMTCFGISYASTVPPRIVDN